MPVDFLNDDQAAAYGGYVGEVEEAELQRYFFLDDEDQSHIDRDGVRPTAWGTPYSSARFAPSAGSCRMSGTYPRGFRLHRGTAGSPQM